MVWEHNGLVTFNEDSYEMDASADNRNYSMMIFDVPYERAFTSS